MGYTHYLERPTILPKKEWNKFIKELEMLKKNLPERGMTAGCEFNERIDICGWNEKSGEYELLHPIYDKTSETIAFNGAGDLGHESFVAERVVKGSRPDKKTGLCFSFCKTARKPYDLFVCLTLISMKRWFMSKVTIGSDGKESDWSPAIELYQKLTDAPITYNMLMRNKKDKD